MLQFIKRIQATRQFRRLVKPGCSEPLSGDELAQLEASWIQMRVETLATTAPAWAKYAFGWVPMVSHHAPSPVKQMPQRPRPTEPEPSETAAQGSGHVQGAPSDKADERVRCQPQDREPVAQYQKGTLAGSAEKAEWFLAFTRQFRKDIDGIDRNLQGRILEAISAICQAPVTPKGDTVKPLVGDSAPLWRYRIGDFRLIYHPDAVSQRMTLLQFASRGSVY